MNSKALPKVAREILSDLLSQCTDSQIEKFNRMYGSLENVKDEQLDTAIFQCETTIAKNKKDESRLLK